MKENRQGVNLGHRGGGRRDLGSGVRRNYGKDVINERRITMNTYINKTS